MPVTGRIYDDPESLDSCFTRLDNAIVQTAAIVAIVAVVHRKTVQDRTGECVVGPPTKCTSDEVLEYVYGGRSPLGEPGSQFNNRGTCRVCGGLLGCSCADRVFLAAVENEQALEKLKSYRTGNNCL